MPLPDLTLKTWRAASTPLHILAIGCTIFRLYHRRRKRQLWWDDYFAAMSMLVDSMYMFAPWIRISDDSIDPSKRPRKILAFWFSTQLHIVVLWTARMSMGMAIARLTPPKTRSRYYLHAMVILFAATCIGQLLHRTIVCTLNTSWHYTANVYCYLGKSLGILSLCSDLIADTCLVYIPLRILWRVKLPRSQRRLVLTIFASSVASSLVGIVYAVFFFQFPKFGGNSGARIGFVSSVKAAVALLVCNLLVIVTYVYCVFWKDDDETTTNSSETRDKRSHSSAAVVIPASSDIVLTEISTPMHTDMTTDDGHLPSSEIVQSIPKQSTSHFRER